MDQLAQTTTITRDVFMSSSLFRRQRTRRRSAKVDRHTGRTAASFHDRRRSVLGANQTDRRCHAPATTSTKTDSGRGTEVRARSTRIRRQWRPSVIVYDVRSTVHSMRSSLFAPVELPFTTFSSLRAQFPWWVRPFSVLAAMGFRGISLGDSYYGICNRGLLAPSTFHHAVY